MGVDHPGLGFSMQDLMREVRRVAKATIQNSAIGRAGLRIYAGGRLTINDGGGIVITDSGYIQIDGDITGVGDFDWSGTFKARGPWELIGSGKVTAELTEWLGDINLSGDLNVIAGGKITAGNVTVEPNKITVGAGAASAVLQDGELKLANGAKLAVGLTGGDSSIGLVPGGSADISANLGTAWMRALGSVVAVSLSTVRIAAANVRMDELPTASSTTGLSWIAADSTGKLWKVPQNVGGPMGGPLQWPFPQSTVRSEYGPRESPGEGGSTFHEGIDFAPGAGTAIPAAGSGTVELAGDNGGFGYCVIINHGGGMKTLYGHMESMPSVSVGAAVSAGQTIGYVGNTGISFGAHLHFEVHVNGTPVNPRTKLPN